MKDMSTKICLEYVMTAKKTLIPLLYEHKKLEKTMGPPLKAEGANHTKWGFDDLAHNLLVDYLSRHELNVTLFSEECEEGWMQIGTGSDYVVVADPFDQSTSATRTFRLAAVAICVMDREYHFKACAIGDLNTDLLYFADGESAYLLSMACDSELDVTTAGYRRVKPSPVKHVEEAFIVCPGMKRSRREFASKSAITAKAAYWLNLDGVLNLGRVAAGYVDAYLDPFVGQPIYEIVCAELVQRAGGIVTDTSGYRFNLSTQVARLREEPQQRYHIVASCTESLQKDLLQLLEEDLKSGSNLVA